MLSSSCQDSYHAFTVSARELTVYSVRSLSAMGTFSVGAIDGLRCCLSTDIVDAFPRAVSQAEFLGPADVSPDGCYVVAYAHAMSSASFRLFLSLSSQLSREISWQVAESPTMFDARASTA